MAKNTQLERADQISLTPTNAPNDPCKSGDPVLFGKLPGVAQTDASDTIANGGKATLKLNGSHRLAVKGHNGTANTAINPGDIVYYDTGANGPLNVNSSGTRFGYAMEAVTSGATTTIKVKVGY